MHEYQTHICRRLLPAACLTALLFGASSITLADEEPACLLVEAQEDQLPLDAIRCISDEELQTLRGGFLLDNQIVIGFGFERIVRINGEIEEHVLAGLPTLNLAGNIQIVPIATSMDAGAQRLILQGVDMGNFASQRSLSDGAMSTLTSQQIQIIPSTAALQEMMNNVIQNTVDGTTIEQMRVLNIDLMGLGDVPRFDPQRDMNPAMFESLGL